MHGDLGPDPVVVVAVMMHGCVHRLQPIALVCTGALTNAALLVSLFPEILPKIEIVLMGGCLGTGNTGSVAEFNIQVNACSVGIRLSWIRWHS